MTQIRRKPWYRPRNIALGFLALSLVFIAWAGYWVYWALTVEPNPSTDYAAQLEQLSRDAQPPGENGWPDILRAFDIYRRLDEVFPHEERVRPELGFFQFEMMPYEEAEAREEFYLAAEKDVSFDEIIEELERVVDWLDEQGMWDAVAAAGAKPNIVMPISTDGGMIFDHKVTDLALTHMLAKIRRVLLRLAIDRNDFADAQRALSDIFTLARTSASQPWRNYYILNHASRSVAYYAITEAAVAGTLAPEMAEALLKLLDQHPTRRDLTLYIEGSRLLALDVIQWFYSDDGDGDGVLLYAHYGPKKEARWPTFITNAAPSHPLNNLRGLAYASRREVTDEANASFDAFLAMNEAEPKRRDELAAEITARMNALDWRYELLRAVVPDYQDTFQSDTWYFSQYDATRIVLAIEMYRGKHGDPPPTLANLAPEFLDAVPIDARSNTTFGYRLLQNDQHGRDYLLYSFGQDGVDNGGIEPESRNDYRTADPDGFDWIINRTPDDW